MTLGALWVALKGFGGVIALIRAITSSVGSVGVAAFSSYSKGRPQFGHAVANVEFWFPQSGQGARVIS